MTDTIHTLLSQLVAGARTLEETLTAIKMSQCESQEPRFARVDHDRPGRCGHPEVVYGEFKSPEQIETIMRSLLHHHGYAFATRLKTASADHLQSIWPEGIVNREARTFLLGTPPVIPHGGPVIGIVAAGTSDLAVAEEAMETLRFSGVESKRFYDVGVAGIHRLFSVRDELESCFALIVVAGMEGALPTVVGGLISSPLIAVPTSVGYGAAFGGVTALLGMLNSCASGVSVVNIDNGFGAGICAARMVFASRRRS